MLRRPARLTTLAAPLFGALLSLGAPTRAASQSVGTMIGHDARDAGGDLVALWAAPLHGSGRDWLFAGGVLATGAAVSLLDDDADRFIVAHQHLGAFETLHFVRETGPLFSGKYIAPPAVALYGLGLATRNRGIRDGTWGCMSAYVGTSVVRNLIIYHLVSRRRPDSTRYHQVPVAPAQQGDQYDLHLGGDTWGHHSFPGGHVANMAACASFLSRRFDTGAYTPLLYSFVGAVGVGRMIDRRHWASDTFLGIALGYAAGKVIADRSLRRNTNALASGIRRERWLPADGFRVTPHEGGVRLQWGTRF